MNLFWPPALINKLSERRHSLEEMDDPLIAAPEHFEALSGLGRINRCCGAANAIWNSIQTFAQQTRRQSFRVLDIATGGGDLPIALWQKTQKADFSLEIDGCDKSPQAIEYAQKCARQSGAEVNFYQHDIVKNGVPEGYDILINSLFLHHLSNEEALDFLQQMARAAKAMIIINDLVRCLYGLWLIQLGTHMLSRSPIVRRDGVLSMRAAFSIAEARELVNRVGLSEVCIERSWPCKFLLVWKRQRNEL